MPTKKANAEWNGDLKSGKGKVNLGSGTFTGSYSFATRFEDAEGTNPEELIGAAHAGCYSMAFSNELAKAGHTPDSVATDAEVVLDMVDGVPTITTIRLIVDAKVSGIEEKEFNEIAEGAKKNCPVSRALAGVANIELDATLNN